MNETNGRVSTGWRAWIAVPLLLPLAVLALPWPGRKSRERTPADVAGYLRGFLERTGAEGDWKTFTRAPIADPELDRIREQAKLATPSPKHPSGDRVKLLELLKRAETLAAMAPQPPPAND